MSPLNSKDWQDLRTNKEIEKISRNLEKKNLSGILTIFEIIMAIITMILGITLNILEDKEKIIISICLLTISILVPVLVFIIREIVIFVKKVKKSNKGVVSAQKYINKFDNEICYHIMTAESFCKSLSQKNNNEVREFYYVECRYYLLKAITQLQELAGHFETLICDDSQFSICGSNKINLSRITNVMNIIELLLCKLKEYYDKSHNLHDEILEKGKCNYDCLKEQLILAEDERKKNKKSKKCFFHFFKRK